MAPAPGSEWTRQHHRPCTKVWAARRLYRSQLLNAQITLQRAISAPTSTGCVIEPHRVGSDRFLGVRALAGVLPARMHGAGGRGVVARQQGLTAVGTTPTLFAEGLEALAADHAVMAGLAQVWLRFRVAGHHAGWVVWGTLSRTIDGEESQTGQCN